MERLSNDNKLRIIAGYLDKLFNIAEKCIEKSKYETALSALSFYSSIQYKVNQVYTDDRVENLLQTISRNLIKKKDAYDSDNNTVLFYDGFGLDRRGIALIMCKAIVKNGYKLIYLSPREQINKQPTFVENFKQSDIVYEYYEKNGPNLSYIKSLNKIIFERRPKVAFFYTYPNDVCGTIVFNSLKDAVYRFQLDLTDHAFWLGINAFDKCNGGRAFSTSIQYYYRHIPREKLSRLDSNLFVDDCKFNGLPFDENRRFIFSGGQLYKTLGDKENTFYRIIDHILRQHSDIVFLYAGSGDDHLIKELGYKYPERVYLIPERPDFYQIMQRCVLYLNTYPMFGGLMMRYAAMAGKIPVTLKHDNDSDGILIDQKSRKIEYETYDELIEDVDRLLSDEKYLRQRESMLDGSVMTEECFIRNVRMMIEEHNTEFPIEEIEFVNTDQFRKEYLERFQIEDIYRIIADKHHPILLRYFPKEYLYGIMLKLKQKIRRRV